MSRIAPSSSAPIALPRANAGAAADAATAAQSDVAAPRSEHEAVVVNLTNALQNQPDYTSLKNKDAKKAQAKQTIDAVREKIRILMLFERTDPKRAAEDAKAIAKDVGSAVKDYADATGDDPLSQADRDFARDAGLATTSLDSVVKQAEAKAKDAETDDADTKRTFRDAKDEIANTRDGIEKFTNRASVNISV